MWICNNCKEKLEDEFDSCWSCGFNKEWHPNDEEDKTEEIDTNTDVVNQCPQCEIENAIDSRFCKSCGVKLIKEETIVINQCTQCDKEYDDSYSFCEIDGAKLEKREIDREVLSQTPISTKVKDEKVLEGIGGCPKCGENDKWISTTTGMVCECGYLHNKDKHPIESPKTAGSKGKAKKIFIIIGVGVFLGIIGNINNKGTSSTGSSSTKSSSSLSCSYSGARSFAKERAGYALSTIKDINSLNMGRVRGMGYDSDYGFLVEGTNNYGTYTILTILISCSNGKYKVDLVETS